MSPCLYLVAASHLSPALLWHTSHPPRMHVTLATPHANSDIQIDLKSSSLFPSRMKHTCWGDVRGGNIWKSSFFFSFFFLSILSCSYETHSLQKTNTSHLQHANLNICWCVCSSAKVHVCGGYTWLGMCSCDSVPRCAERTCRADLTSWWMERNGGESYRRKFLHMYLMQCKNKIKKKWAAE